MSETTDLSPLSFFTRFWFAWIAFFRVVFDGEFAARVWDVREPRALPPSPKEEPKELPPKAKEPEPAEKSVDGALQLLGLFQREGRLVDFLTQEIAPFADAEIGATARVIHEGCRKALLSHATIVPLRAEDEDTTVTLNAGFDPAEVKLTGNVKGTGPYRGVLRHRGWRAKEITLPAAVSGHDASILCPAEVEL